MAAFHGKRGVATFTNLTFELQSWSIDATADTADVSVMDVSAAGATKHWKDYVAGFKDWTATAECLEPAAGGGIAALGTEATLTMDSTDGLAYAGTAICTGFSPSSSVDDAGRLTLSFQGVSQLAAT
jgi:hypothetical protein